MKPAMKNTVKAGSFALGLSLMLSTLCYGQATMPLDGSTAAQALPTAGPARPATVPADYVITPFGYFHPSCVMQLGNGDEVRKDENAIRHSNGTYDSIQACAYAHYEANGETVTGDKQGLKQPTIGHAWVEAAATKISTSFGYLYAYWSVPPAPSKNDGQIVFLFPGVEDYKDFPVRPGSDVSIIQPVLGWNSDYRSAWGIASWNCCVSGTVFEAPPVRVNSGDTIFGYMFDTCSPGTLSCPTWDVVALDLTSGRFSELLNTSSFGQTFNWAFAGVLEVYNIVQCGDYPSNGSISFYNLGLYDYRFIKIASPAWSVLNAAQIAQEKGEHFSGLTPQCGYGGSLPQQVTLTY
jgi:hypothetical protein